MLEQLAFADLVVINKTDLVSLEESAAVEPRIRSVNPMAAIEHAERWDLALDKVPRP
ncbi:GTP-binding protein [Devosia sp. CAU 1758]